MSDFVDFATYSTSEQVVGIWIDGKTLYRRVITGTITASANIRSSTDILTGVDSIVNGNGAFTESSSTDPLYVLIPGSRINSSNTITGFSSILNINGTVTLYTRSEYARSNSPFYVIIEYTKK